MKLPSDGYAEKFADAALAILSTCDASKQPSEHTVQLVRLSMSNLSEASAALVAKADQDPRSGLRPIFSGVRA